MAHGRTIRQPSGFEFREADELNMLDNEVQQLRILMSEQSERIEYLLQIGDAHILQPDSLHHLLCLKEKIGRYSALDPASTGEHGPGMQRIA